MKAITPTTIHFCGEDDGGHVRRTKKQFKKWTPILEQINVLRWNAGAEDAFKLLDKYAKDFEKELKTLRT